VLAGHRGAVTALAFTPDGASLLSGSEDRTVRRWDLRGGAHWMREVGRKVRSLTMSPDGSLISVGASTEPRTTTRSLQLLRVDDGSPGPLLAGLPEMENALGTVYHSLFGPDGRWLAAGDAGVQGVVVWEIPSGRRLRLLEVAGRHGVAPRWFALHPHGHRLAAVYGDGTINVWSPSDGTLRLQIPGRPSGQIFFSPDGARLYANGYEAIEVRGTR
jgi:WD40 repeat protein